MDRLLHATSVSPMYGCGFIYNKCRIKDIAKHREMLVFKIRLLERGRHCSVLTYRTLSVSTFSTQRILAYIFEIVLCAEHAYRCPVRICGSSAD